MTPIMAEQLFVKVNSGRLHGQVTVETDDLTCSFYVDHWLASYQKTFLIVSTCNVYGLFYLRFTGGDHPPGLVKMHTTNVPRRIINKNQGSQDL